jgi:folate-dependent tRNA-U54 methylase TrmFO/GidA
MVQSQAAGSLLVRPGVPFNAVKVFSATMFADRDQLGEKVTRWVADHPHVQVTEMVVTQSSDASFHCIAITVFYRDPARSEA